MITPSIDNAVSMMPLRNDCGSRIFGTRTRFALMILVLFCLASIWSNILTFNFAIICMNPENDTFNNLSITVNFTNLDQYYAANVTDLAQTDVENDDSYVFTPDQKRLLTSIVALSALIATFPLVALSTRIGIRSVFTVCGMLSATATFAIPTAIRVGGFQSFVALRVVQGVAFAVNFAVIGAFTSRWTYCKQNGLFVSALVAHVQLAPALTMPISGWLCSSPRLGGWPSVFYVHGVCAFALFALFAAFYRNSPHKHPLVSAIELEKMGRGKISLSLNKNRKTPYAAICSTRAVWAIWIAAFGNFCCINTLFLFAPAYLHRVLGFHVNSTGLSAALPPLAQFVIKLLAGYSSDRIRCISETNKLRAFNSIAFLGAAAFLTTLAFMPVSWQLACLAMLAIATGIFGVTTGGFFKAAPIVSMHYSAFVTGNISLANTLTMLLVPFLVTGLAPNNTASGWRNVFIAISVILFVTNACFVLMISGEPATWTTQASSGGAAKVYDVSVKNGIESIERKSRQTR